MSTNLEEKPIIQDKRKNLTTITKTTNYGNTVTKESMQFITQEGKDQGGCHVSVHEVLGNHYAHVQKTGIAYRSFTATVIVGKGDDNWEKDAERFRDMCLSSSNQTPLKLEGMPNIPSINCIIGIISNTFSGMKGITIFNIAVYPIYQSVPPKLEHKKLLSDELSETVDSWSDKVNDAFSFVETTESYIAGISNFFTSIGGLLSSGIQYIDFGMDLISILKNPFALGNTLKSTLKAYIGAIDHLIQTSTTERIANNPTLFYKQTYPYSNNQYSKGQEDFLIQLSNLSAVTFLKASSQKIDSTFIKFDHLMNYRQHVLSILNNMSSVLLKYAPASGDLNTVYQIQEYFNGYFDILYPQTSRGKYITADCDTLPSVFYFNHTGTMNNYEYFEQDNDLKRELYLKKGREVFLRNEY